MAIANLNVAINSGSFIFGLNTYFHNRKGTKIFRINKFLNNSLKNLFNGFDDFVSLLQSTKLDWIQALTVFGSKKSTWSLFNLFKIAS